MEEHESPHPDYLKGFNEGYMMSQYMPELAEKLNRAVGESLRGTGFQEGRQQLIQDQKQNRYPAWLKSDRLSSLDNSPAPSKDKDMDEPKH